MPWLSGLHLDDCTGRMIYRLLGGSLALNLWSMVWGADFHFYGILHGGGF